MPVLNFLHSTSRPTEIVDHSRHLCSHMASWSQSYIGKIGFLIK